MDIHSRDEWERLGTELRRRRGELGYGSRERKRFAADAGLHYRLVQRLETGEREGYPPETIAQAESAYQLERNAIGTFFATGHLALRSRASDAQETIMPLDAFERRVTEADLPHAEKVAAVHRHREQISLQLAELGLSGGIPDFVRRSVRRGDDGPAEHQQDARPA